MKSGNKVTGQVIIAAQDGFSGTATLSCTFSGGNLCTVSPASVNKFPATVSVTIDATTVASGAYTASLSAVSGVKSHALPLPFTVTDYTATATTPAAVAQGQTTTSTITISPVTRIQAPST